MKLKKVVNKKYDIDLEISDYGTKEIMAGKKQQATGFLFMLAGLIMIMALLFFSNKLHFIKAYDKKPMIVLSSVIFVYGLPNFAWGKIKVWSAKK